MSVGRYTAEPPFAHDAGEHTGIVLANLGTPDAPTAPALRRYLRQFLWDPRVVEIPRPLWWLILNAIILPLRPARSARRYAAIWMPEGSPLRVHTERQARLLETALAGAELKGLIVDYAMRYGEPSIAAVLERLRAAGCRRILLVPMYPQYAASTTASTLDEAARALLAWRNVPEIRYVRGFHDHPAYIAALAASVRAHWAEHGRGGRLVMSFHGIPRRSLDLGDPYHCECRKTARLLGEALGLAEQDYLVSFQSRFGRAQWLQPYTQASLEGLARGGLARADVVCPGFVADCLETIEEIGIECKAAFLGAGGREFHRIECLNERPEWIEALASIAIEHLGNWRDIEPPGAAELALRAGRARALGARR
ncbi:MAG: ferrochelatase [Rhodocyclaceae bacterium]